MIEPTIEDRVRDFVRDEASVQPPPWLASRILNTVDAARPAPARDPFRLVRVAALVAGLLLIGASIAWIRLIGAGPSPAGLVEGTWSSASGMASGRGYHTATLLPNGKVLVVGGYQVKGHKILGSAELYDPATRTWTPAGNLETPRFNHTATLLRTGKVLVVGGQSATYFGLPFTLGRAESSAVLYDPRTNRWSPAASMATARTEHTATLLADGRVLVAGGYTPWPDGYATVPDVKVHASAEVYDPDLNRWTRAGPLATARAKHSAVLLADHRVLVMGGVDLAYLLLDFSSTLRSAELYDPATGAWSAVPSMRSARIHPTSTLLPNGRLLVVGDMGISGSSAELFDQAANRWLSVPDSGAYRAGQLAVSLRDGNVLVVGGVGESKAQLYDWRRNAWRGGGSLVVNRASAAGTVLANGQALVAGGFGATQDAFVNVDLYDPSGQPPTAVIPPGAAGASSPGSWPALGIGVLVFLVALWSFRRRARGSEGGGWLDVDR